MADTPYDPKIVFAQANETPPRVLIAPQRYIQGAGVLDHTGHYINSLMNVKRAGILASKRGLGAQGAKVAASLKAESIESMHAQFNGECSLVEIEAQVGELKDQQLDCLVAVGGGKVVDAGKCVAYRLDVPVVIVPTIVSNDAPCSALSVVYKPEGTTDRVEFFPQNPAMVVVDTDVVADADERYLVAGMGDAMATWYEAKVCLNNSAARNMVGAKPTLASCAMAEICAQTLFEHGEAAAESVLANRNNEAVDKVVEANTLLSGIGFESGGLALAHAIALAYPEIDVVYDNYLHGEMVAMGTMAQLMMEQADDAERVAQFLARVGLPVHLEQMSLSVQHSAELDTLIEATLERPIAHNMPMPVTHDTVREAILAAHELGLRVAADAGDAAYRRLHS
jgi:glycerol dehydrogenase